MHKNYLLYLIKEIEKELFAYANNPNFGELLKFLNVIKKISEKNQKDELLKYSYILLKTKYFEKLGSYLLFVIKKSDEEVINFENLNDNLSLDKEFIKNILLSIFGIKPEDTEQRKETKIKIEDSNIILENIQKSKEAYETLEKEFLSSNIADLDLKETQKKKLVQTQKHELIEKGKDTTDKIGDEPVKTEETSELTLITNQSEIKDDRVYDVPEEKEFIDVNEKIKTTVPDKKYSADESKLNIKNELKKDTKDTSQVKKKGKEEEKEKLKPKISKRIYINHFDEDFVEIDSTPKTEEEKTIEQNITIENIKNNNTEENKAFKQYESQVYAKNLVISEALGKIRDVVNSTLEKLEEWDATVKSKQVKRKTPGKAVKTQITEKINFEELEIKNSILEEAVKNIMPPIKNVIAECDYMEKLSKEISFEIITNIYNTIYENMKKNLEDLEGNVESIRNLKEEKINLFLNSIILVRKLISGEDYTGYENVVAEMEKEKLDLIREKEEEERKKRLEIEKEEIEKKLTEKYSDLAQRRKLLILKDRILNIENIFKSLDSIEGEYQIYNALTTLSKTFNYIKDIVKLSKELKIENMAKLSEASYIFIKFIQNYRMNPLSKDIKEILNYIVVNLKLLFLEKKTRDLELFISYLNNPERIFS